MLKPDSEVHEYIKVKVYTYEVRVRSTGMSSLVRFIKVSHHELRSASVMHGGLSHVQSYTYSMVYYKAVLNRSAAGVEYHSMV